LIAAFTAGSVQPSPCSASRAVSSAAPPCVGSPSARSSALIPARARSAIGGAVSRASRELCQLSDGCAAAQVSVAIKPIEARQTETSRRCWVVGACSLRGGRPARAAGFRKSGSGAARARGRRAGSRHARARVWSEADNIYYTQ
jgi:hypothetical protein